MNKPTASLHALCRKRKYTRIVGGYVESDEPHDPG